MGLISRAIEQAGIATLTMSVGRDITEHVRPPRAAFVNYPMGNEVGRPHNAAEQRQIVAAAFGALTLMTEPGMIVDLGFSLDQAAPDGGSWEQWVYTKNFRETLMRTRGGQAPVASG